MTMTQHVHDFNRFNVVRREWVCLCEMTADEANYEISDRPPDVVAARTTALHTMANSLNAQRAAEHAESAHGRYMNCGDIPQWRLRHAALYANTVYRLCTACMNVTVRSLAGKRTLDVEWLP